MTSEKQILANRANSLKSTGPRTQEGKRIASRNSIVHGLLAGDILIKGEEADQYEAFRAHLRSDLLPVGQLETLLAERITGFFWRLARAGRMEQGLLDLLQENPDPISDNRTLPFSIVYRKTYEKPSDDPDFQEFLRWQTQKDETVARQEVIEANGPPAPPAAVDSLQDNRRVLGRMVRSDFAGPGRLERLLRYEGHIERSLYRALAELQKLQYIRKRNEAISGDDPNPELDEQDVTSPAVEPEKRNEPISHDGLNPQNGGPAGTLPPGGVEKPNEAIATESDCHAGSP